MNKTLVSGSRSITSLDVVEEAIQSSPFTVDYIIHGGAKGVDTLADAVASMHNIPADVCKPNYDRYGDRAPLKRNEEMIQKSDNAVVVWDGKSSGTWYTMSHALDSGMEKLDSYMTNSGTTVKYLE
jgi:predicted Rossmann fold nucleotide-binding protein DprA/Smf involved in DNA uptake